MTTTGLVDVPAAAVGDRLYTWATLHLDAPIVANRRC
jgi:hypothetical protein